MVSPAVSVGAVAPAGSMPVATFASPKSSSFAPALREHHVARLQVPVDDALPVGGGQGVGDLGRHGQRLLERQRSLLEAVGERLAREVLHHQEGRTVVLADVVERADVRVVQAGDGLRFALEAGAAVRVGADLGREDLDGDGAVEAGVAGLVDLAHAAGADGGEDLVRAEAGTRREGHGDGGRL